jgi:heme-degrading monooxygenase HmoA
MEPNRTGQIAVIFTSRRNGKDDAGYSAAARAMEELAAIQPGFRGIESARLPDGFGISVSYWADEQNARAWKSVAEHGVVQTMGRTHWYESFNVHVATITRSYGRPDYG